MVVVVVVVVALDPRRHPIKGPRLQSYFCGLTLEALPKGFPFRLKSLDGEGVE